MGTTVKLIMDMTIVTPKRIIELKERAGETEPKFIPGFGLTEPGYGTVDCTSDLSGDELIGLIKFLNNKLLERLEEASEGKWSKQKLNTSRGKIL